MADNFYNYFDFENVEDLPPYEQEAREFLLDPANFEFEGEEYEDEFLEEEEMGDTCSLVMILYPPQP